MASVSHHGMEGGIPNSQVCGGTSVIPRSYKRHSPHGSFMSAGLENSIIVFARILTHRVVPQVVSVPPTWIICVMPFTNKRVCFAVSCFQMSRTRRRRTVRATLVPCKRGDEGSRHRYQHSTRAWRHVTVGYNKVSHVLRPLLFWHGDTKDCVPLC